MEKLVTAMSLAVLLCYGAESIKMSKKDYEDIEKLLEFGTEALLNSLDKVRDVTEEMMKDNQLKTNSFAIQDHWNSFKETAKRISVEERGKGEQDDLLAAARTIQRLGLFYKDDIQGVFRSLTKEKGVQQYLPALNMLKGFIKKEQLDDIWQAVESLLLSTNTLETFGVNILKTGAEVISQIKNMDFQKLQKSAAARAFVSYWDTFLDYTDSPEIGQKLEEAQEYSNLYTEAMPVMDELLHSLFPSDLMTDAFWLNLLNVEDIYEVGSNLIFKTFGLAGLERTDETLRAFEKAAAVVFTPILEKLTEMDVSPAITGLYRVMNITLALAEDKEFETFRAEATKYWKAFSGEADRVFGVERKNLTAFMLPQVRAGVQLLSNFSNKLINNSINNSDIRQLAKNLEKMRKTCTEKLLTSGLITQTELEDFERVIVKGFFKFLNLAGEQGMRDSLRNLYKASLELLNFINSPSTEGLNFISV